MDIMSIGEMVIDFLPGDAPGVYIRKPGGAPANIAVAMARNRCDVGFCGRVGNDDFGRFLVQTLKDNHVRPLVDELENRATTTMAFVTLEENGDRSFTFARKPGADMFLSRMDIKDEYLEESTIIHAGSCSLSKGDAVEATQYTLAEGHRRGKIVSFDINYRDLLWENDRLAAAAAINRILSYVDLLKVSDEEVDMIGGEERIAGQMLAHQITLVVETLGANGAICYFGNNVYHMPALKADCVDTTGAGDAFWGGFLSSLIHSGLRQIGDVTNEMVQSAMQVGSVAGWLCVQKKGAMESLPSAEEIDKYRMEFFHV